MRRAPDERSAGPRSSLRGAALILTAAVSGLATAGCRGEKADPPSIDAADVRIDLGLARVIDSKRWSILRVRALNRGADFRGVIEVRGSVLDADESVVTTAPVEIAGKSGAVREVLVPIRPDGWTGVTVTFRQADWTASFRKEIFLSEDAQARVLVVARRVMDLSTLESAIPTASREVKVIPPGDLVPEPLAYDAFQAIVLLGVTLGDAPQGTAEALGRWVERGGTLLAFPGPEWASGVPGATLDLLGIDLGDPGAKLPGDVVDAIGPAAGRGYYRAIAPRQGTRGAFWGLWLFRARGTGSLITFSFGPGEGKFPDEQDAPVIRGTIETALAEAIRRPGGARPFASIEGEIVTNLFDMSGSFIPPRYAVLLGIAVYLALGFFLPWTIFSRLRRREWTYAVVVVAAGAASLGIYRFGLLSARANAEMEEISILRLHPNGGGGEVSSFIAIVSPHYQRKDLFRAGDRAGAPQGGDLPQLLRVPAGDGSRSMLGSGTMEWRDGRLRLAPVTLYPNGIFYLRSDYEADPAALPEIAFEGEDDAGSPQRVRIANPRGVPLTVYRVARRHFERRGRVEPGTPFVAELELAGAPAMPPLQEQYYGRQPPDVTEFRLLEMVVPLLQRDSIVLVSHEGVFPPGREFPSRNAVTITVIEVPGWHAD